MSGSIFFILTLFLAMFSGITIMYGVSNTSISSSLQSPIDCDINSVGAFCSFPAFSPPKSSNATIQSSNAPPFPQCVGVGFQTLNPGACFQSVVLPFSNVGIAISNGLGLVFYSLGYFGILMIVFFVKVSTGIVLIYQITLLMSQTFGIPFLNYLFLGFIIFYIMYGLSMLKPGGSGLPG